MDKEENKLSQYVDTSGTFSSRQLKLSEWYIRNKILLEKIGTILMIIVASISMGTALFLWGKYLFIGYWQDEKVMLTGQVNQFQDYTGLRGSFAAKDLELSAPKVFKSATDVYDFVAEVINPNERWVAHVSYNFTTSEGNTETEKRIILPREQTLITEFGIPDTSLPSATKLTIENIIWEKIDPHYIFDVENYIKSRKSFLIDNFLYESQREGGIGAARITFDFFNNSAYSYWLPGFYLELLNKNKTVGYLYFTAEEFKAGEKREMDLRYFGSDLTVTNYKIIPIINFFDEDEYMSPEDK